MRSGASYGHGYDDAATGRAGRPARGLSGVAAQDLVEDMRARGYEYREGVSGADVRGGGEVRPGTTRCARRSWHDATRGRPAGQRVARVKA